MKRVNRRVVIVILIVAIVLAIPGLYFLDRYDIPSLMIYSFKGYVKKLKLTVNPIVVTDGQIFESISKSLLLSEDLRTMIDKGEYESAWKLYQSVRAYNATSAALFDPKAMQSVFGSLSEDQKEALERILILADDYADDRFAVLGKGAVVLGKDFSWTHFPLDYPDVIFIWEVNTLQHLTLLAEARMIRGDEKYFNAIARHLESWLEENPIDNSINWVDPMEVSIRLYSLLWMGEMLARDERMGEIFPELVKTIYAHALYVAKNIDKPRKRNNHGIFAAMGLYFAAVTYPEFAEAAEWKSFSENRILDELGLQYTNRGVNKEFAPAYHLPLLEAYLHYIVVKMKLGEEISRSVLESIEAQVRFLACVTDPDGNLMLIGDSSDHHFLRLDAESYDDAEPVLLLGALIFHERRFVPGDPGAIWEPALLLGYPIYTELLELLEASEPIHVDDEIQMECYENEGFVRVESDGLLLFCDFARFGAEPHFMGHNHCDIGSFLLWAGSDPIVIDPGTYTYRSSLDHGGVKWREFLRSSSAHSVTVVDGMSQNVPINDFEYSNWPEAKLLTAGHDEGQFMAVGEHLAYKDIIGAAKRIYALSEKVLIVVDWFPEAAGEHSYVSNFILGASDVVRTRDAIRVGDLSILGRRDIEVFEGSYNPPAGWGSRSYGSLDETCQLRSRVTAAGSTAIPFCFYFEQAEDGPTEFTMEALSNNCFAVVYAVDDSREIILLLNPNGAEGGEPISYNGICTDAYVSLYDGKRSVLVYNGSYFRSNEMELDFTVLQ